MCCVVNVLMCCLARNTRTHNSKSQKELFIVSIQFSYMFLHHILVHPLLQKHLWFPCQVRSILPLLSKPMVFFGHSMGSHIMYCVAQTLWESSLPIPVHLIASGRLPPHLTHPDRSYVAFYPTHMQKERLVLSVMLWLLFPADYRKGPFPFIAYFWTSHALQSTIPNQPTQPVNVMWLGARAGSNNKHSKDLVRASCFE